MAIFAKKQELDQRVNAEGGSGAAVALGAGSKTPRIGEAIQLMRSLPVDQHPDLVVRVVRATLGSLNVHLPDIIEDASLQMAEKGAAGLAVGASTLLLHGGSSASGPHPFGSKPPE
jgi:hypothetical protein